MNQELINLILGVVLALVGWCGKTLWTIVTKLKDDVTALEISLPNNYVKKVDIEARFDKIDMMFEKLFNRLDKKADKTGVLTNELFQQSNKLRSKE